MNDKPLVGISACLLGDKVRYDGGDKLDPDIRDVLGKQVEFIGICPEQESGMGVPREAMRLVNVDGNVRLMTQQTAKDMTQQMQTWMQKNLAELSGLPAVAVHASGILLVTSRVLHAWGLSHSPGRTFGRFYGTAGTWLVIIGLSLYVMYAVTDVSRFQGSG